MTSLQASHSKFFSQRELAIWAAFVLLANNLAGTYIATYTGGFDWAWIERSGFGVFDALAWGVAIWRIFRTSPSRAAAAYDTALLLGLCLLCGLRQAEAVALAVTGFALWLLFIDELEARAAGALLFAVATHQMWAHFIFDVASPVILRADTAIAGGVMTLFVEGVRWRDNLITMPNGFGIAVLEGCSSFANVSTGLLAWIALLKLERARWVGRDLWVALLSIVAQVALNTCRLIFVAQSEPMYIYWHNGRGAQIYSTVASVIAVLIGVLGSRWAAARE